jgi:acetate kinase
VVRRILSIDLGSSSLKIAVYEFGGTKERKILGGGIERLGSTNAALHLTDRRASPPREASQPLGEGTPASAVLSLIRELGIEVDAVGHRLVFGGADHEEPVRVTPSLLTVLDGLVPLDPLHMPNALAAIREIVIASPWLTQVVCFDTAFHRRMPTVAQRLPLPRELWAQGVRRYGFHGLSYESVVRGLGETGTRGRMIVAHLGNGASVAGMQDGKPLDTTMGFSPLGGLMMGTRPGDLDPGVMLYLLRERIYTLAELSDVVTDRSGLLGVSETSADMEKLLEQRQNHPFADEAIELFVYQARKHIGALAAVTGGLDTLVFTGGIGERAAPIRSEICRGLAYLGVRLDPARNAAGGPVISSDGAGVAVRVFAANENLMVARHTFDTLFA